MNLVVRLFGRELLAVEFSLDDDPEPERVTRSIGFAAAEIADPCGRDA